ncbi:MAG: ABC transporter permease [candidate division Zixibacteria bacterium]|nr:ABC transporter permease [candidate division Zixibacteria bacterium]
MSLFLTYGLRNLFVRKLTTTMTVLGMGLVVFVFAAVLMLAHGLEETLVDTGSPDNAIVVRAAASAETVSIMSRDQAGIARTQPEVALKADGTPVATNELIVMVNLSKRKNGDAGNVIIRGTTPDIFVLRSGIKLTAGRMFTPGTSEIIVGKRAAENFKGCALGEHITSALRDWNVVGVFDAGGTGFDSELWGDVEQIQQVFKRPIYSSVTLRLKDPAQFDALKKRLEADPRMTVDVKRERQFYTEQSQATATFIRVIGLLVSIIFAVGAVIGAMITMYASVSNRTVEIGTLRAIGFSRTRILGVFLIESVWLSILGWVVGVIAASAMSLVTVSTTNWDTFAELAFSFALSSRILIGSLVFSVVMGLVGGFLPAVRASRARIVESLREAA